MSTQPPYQRTEKSCEYVLTPDEVLERGLMYMGIEHKRWASWETRVVSFKNHYGSSPRVLAQQWYDLTVTELPCARLNKEEVSEAGFRRFMQAHNWLWSYPDNAGSFASRWKQCKRYSYGKRIWEWIEKIAALKEEKIVWESELDEDDGDIFIVTVDGVDFRVNEPNNGVVNVDKKQHSHKYKHAALKYEIAVGLVSGKAVHVSGPYRGGMSDKRIFDQSTGPKIKEGKLAITDGGYDGRAKCSITNPRESKEVRQFKSRARARHETFNGRLSFYRSLNDTFRHSRHKCLTPLP